MDAPHRKLAIIDAPKTEEPGTEAKNTGNDVITSECTSDMRMPFSLVLICACSILGHYLWLVRAVFAMVIVSKGSYFVA